LDEELHRTGEQQTARRRAARHGSWDERRLEPKVSNDGFWKRAVRVAVTLTVMAPATHLGAAGQPAVNPRAAALKAFSDRVGEYLALREGLDGKVPQAGAHADAAAVARHRDALAEAIRQARAGVQEGTIFTPDVASQFRGIIRADLEARDFRDAIAAVQEVAYRSVRVNMSWPQDAPRPTIPPRLLTKLHPLPEGLEYRLLDRHLVLLDEDAQLVVDFVRNVLPSDIRPKVKTP
jgi:hypothetical protein